MKDSLVEILACPTCRLSPLRLSDEMRQGSEVVTGRLSCPNGHTFAIVDGIARFVDSDQYVGSFSFEWRLHRTTQLDDDQDDASLRVFRRKTDLNPTDFAGKRVLDVGVGAGRYADLFQHAGAEIVGLDLSHAVETSMENVGRRPNAHVVQADAFKPPFRDEQFDLIYSIGVLHHTPDCKRAFLGLTKLLKPGGTIVIWVYDAHVWSPGSVLSRVNDLWRSVTTRLPSRLLYALCLCEVPFFYLRKIPGLDAMMHLILPGFLYHAIPKTSNKPRLDEHVLDTFDWYSPKYQSKHTYPEVFGWFESAGLTSIRIHPFPVGVSGRRPPGATPKALHSAGASAILAAARSTSP